MENSHISALSAKHAGLDARIKAETSRPMPDATLVASLKKQKLRLKEEMSAKHEAASSPGRRSGSGSVRLPIRPHPRPAFKTPKSKTPRIHEDERGYFMRL